MSKSIVVVIAITIFVAAGVVWVIAKHVSAPPRRTPLVSPAPHSVPSSAQTSTTPSDTQIYRNDKYGFTLTYPSEFKIETRSSANSRYETDFRLTTGTSTVPLTLQVTDLDKYLPLTNTPTVREYLQTFNGLDKFEKATIDDKDAYKYLICGRAACSQEVIFIHNEKQYQFSIEYGAYFPNGQIIGNVNPKSISFENAPSYIRQIIESLQFLPAT